LTYTNSDKWAFAAHNHITSVNCNKNLVNIGMSKDEVENNLAFVALKFSAAEGTYIPTLSHALYKTSPIVDIYLVKEDVVAGGYTAADLEFKNAASNGDAASAVNKAYIEALGDEYKIASRLDMYMDSEKYVANPAELSSRTLEDGTYYLFIRPVGFSGSETANARNMVIYSLTLTPVEKVSVGVYAENGGNVSLGGTDTVASVNIGSSQIATATPYEGYKFAYWKDASGDFVSSSASYPFNAYSNTYLIAVFDNVSDDADEIAVEFYDGDRDCLGKETLTESKAFKDVTTPNNYGVTGYDFTGWSIDGETVIDSLTRAVALYAKEGKAINGATVTVTDGTVTTYENVKYDRKIEATASGEGFSYWTRDDKIISYDEHYEYYAWDSAEIEAVYNAEATDEAPCIVIQSANESIAADAYMIEYDEGACEIVEAGIIFGTDVKSEVSSCYSKAKVSVPAEKAHGQFTASKNANGTAAMQTVVRGYIIYKDKNGNYKTKYADLA
ncbi:MAG: hypothetical protein IJF32_13090, partial [Oscillospiraceae bacterium]|nr:hypothetical protein [Oscillospiraceae bacterium]